MSLNWTEYDRSYAGQASDYVGNPVQQGMQSRAYNLWRSVRSDTRYAYEGRLVALDGTKPETIEELLFLVREQLAGVSWYVDPDDEIVLTEKLKGMGYLTDRWDHYVGTAEAVRASEKICREMSLPAGYEISEINADTPHSIIAEFATVGAEQGVMVPAAHVMRSHTRPSAIMYATGPDGKIAAIAGSVLGHHDQSPLATSAWWGMLCTHPAHRGKGLSKMLGAMTIRGMATRYGATSFYTGVRRDNAVSQAVCTRLGVHRSEYSVLMAMSPKLSDSGPLTR